MAKVNMQTELQVPVDQVWEMIGKFNALPDWHPAVESSTLEDDGRIRRLRLFGGGEIVERLEKLDEGDRLYRYSIVNSPLPVTNLYRDYPSEGQGRWRGDRRAVV